MASLFDYNLPSDVLRSYGLPSDPNVTGSYLTLGRGVPSGHYYGALGGYRVGSTSQDRNLFRQYSVPNGFNIQTNFRYPVNNSSLSIPDSPVTVSTQGASTSNPQTDPVQREIDLNKMYLDMDPSDALSLAWKKDPWGVSMGLANGVLNTAGSIWDSVQKYRTSKQALDLANKDYELKKQAYEANEARNQERFNWLRQARATSQL
jgi:hypothetical protein